MQNAEWGDDPTHVCFLILQSSFCILHWRREMPLDLPQLATMFVLTLVRIGGMMLFAPLFGSARIPRRVKGMLAVVLAVSICPTLTPPAAMPGTVWEFSAGIAGEMAFGLAMGMIQSFVFIAAQWAGEIIGQQMGFNLSEVFDPQFGSQGSIVGELYFMLTLVVFLSIGGHRTMLLGLRDSFDTLPLLSLGVDGHLFHQLVTFFHAATELAMRLAAPMLVTMLVVDLALGLVGKIMPQLNIMALGLSLRSGLGLVVVILGLTMTHNAVKQSVADAMETVHHAWTTG
jgi:flagellar biosynthetic protein FliR